MNNTKKLKNSKKKILKDKKIILMGLQSLYLKVLN